MPPDDDQAAAQDASAIDAAAGAAEHQAPAHPPSDGPSLHESTDASPAPSAPLDLVSPSAEKGATSTPGETAQDGDNDDEDDEDDMDGRQSLLASFISGHNHYHPPSTAEPAATGYASSTGATAGHYASYPAGTTPTSSALPVPSARVFESSPAQLHSLQPRPPVATGPATSIPSVLSSTVLQSSHGVATPPMHGSAADTGARYAIPHDPRLLSSRAHKKEIKRRTKTGCLTCRKRRIKCDETQPTCNNCKKSKRECLGYDPIFRQQPHHSPHIQLAPAAHSNTSSTSPTATYVAPSAGHPQANSYGSQPSMLPSSYSTAPNPSATASPSTTQPSPVSHSSPKPEPNYSTPNPKPAYPPASGSEDRPALTTAPAPDGTRLSFKVENSPSIQPARNMKISDIIDQLGPPPPPQPISHTEETFNEITKVYHEMYAGGLSAFLETTWYYFVDGDKMSFPKDANLIEHMATFLKILEAVKANDHAQMTYSGILETRIVWELACTAYQTPDSTSPAARVGLPPDGDAAEAKNRVRVIDTLLCGEHLAFNPLTPPTTDSDPHRTRQFDFWYSLAESVRRRDNPSSAASAKAREDALGRMRCLLDGRENRDVLYSIAVVRHLAPSYGPNYINGGVPHQLDETDPKNRLIVASRFLLEEAQVTGGTTNVVRRISDIAARAFVNPGVNVAKPG